MEIKWSVGTVSIEHVMRREGLSLIFGAKIDGIFNEHVRLTFDSEVEIRKALIMSKQALNEAKK